MNFESISLKKHCQERYSFVRAPSIHDKIFSQSSFLSPTFVEDFTKSLSPPPIPDLDNHLISSLVSTIVQEFNMLRDSIASLESLCIKEAVALLTEKNEAQELEIIKAEMQKCHVRLCQNDQNEVLVEDFARLVNRYESAQCKVKHIDRSHVIIEMFGEFVDDINTVIVKMEEKVVEGFRHMAPLFIGEKDRKSSTSVETLTEKSKNLYRLEDKEIYDKGSIIHWNSQDYLNFISLTRNDAQFTARCEALNFKTGKPISLFCLNSKEERTPTTLFFFSKLGILALVDYYPTAVKLYHLSPKKTLLVGFILVRSLFPKYRESAKIAVEIMPSYNILIISCQNDVKFISVMTRKTLFEWKETETHQIIDIKYMEKLNYLAVGLSCGALKVYSVDKSSYHVHLRHRLDIKDIINDESMGLLQMRDSELIVASFDWLYRFRFDLTEVKHDKIRLYHNMVDRWSCMGFHIIDDQIIVNYGYYRGREPLQATGMRTLSTTKDKLDKDDNIEKNGCILIGQGNHKRLLYNTQTGSVTLIQEEGQNSELSP